MNNLPHEYQLLRVIATSCIFGELKTRVAMFRGDKEPVQLDKIFKLTGYPKGEVLQIYNGIEEFKNFNCDKTYTNQFAAKYLIESNSGGSSSAGGGSGKGGSSTSTCSLHQLHEAINAANHHQLHPMNQSNSEVNYKVFDADGLDLLQRLLDIHPGTRITAGDAMTHSYFQKANPHSYNPAR